ncbi:14761_t:CDS:2 [Entrophospora sp. SA101]|nr:14761_t:CDS:2 [Entrophospora sp. SA101]
MAGILCIAKFFKFSLRTTYDSESFIIKGGQILLQDIFAEKYTSFVNALAKKQVSYLDQILCCEGTHLLFWKQVVLCLSGQKPKWFSSLEESILHHSSREVLDQWKLPRCNSFPVQDSLNFPKDSRIRPFIATYRFEEITFGKTYELASPKNNNQLIITHWKSNTNILENNHDSFQLSQCKGCELNNLTNNPNRIGCLYNKPQKECIVIPAKKYNSSGSNIITITFPRLAWIKNIINEPISLQLFNIHMINNCINQLEFWTDGSLKNPSSPDIKLGYGWIQVDKNKKITNSFSGALSQWPTSTCAEIFSLLTAILTCPANSIINIYLDSQATIDGFNNWKQKSKTIRSYLKINNFSLWESIYSTMEKYNLIVNLTKVKAHSNKYPLNDTVDSLAKLGRVSNRLPL